MATRSWRWLRTRIEGLLNRPAVSDVTGRPRYSTRIQTKLWQPAAVALDQQREAE